MVLSQSDLIWMLMYARERNFEKRVMSWPNTGMNVSRQVVEQGVDSSPC